MIDADRCNDAAPGDSPGAKTRRELVGRFALGQ